MKKVRNIFLVVGSALLIIGVMFIYRHFTYHPYCMGIDVSHHNNIISLNPPDSYRALDSIQFLIAKATQGKGFVDRRYKNHRDYAKERNLKFGAYHFLTRESNTFDQFKNFKKIVGKNIDIIPCLDIERYDNNHWHRSEARKKLQEWNKLCIEYYGVYPIVYCNEFYHLVYFLDFPNKFWISNWITRPLLDCAIHQYTSNDETLDYNYLSLPIDSILMKF